MAATPHPTPVYLVTIGAALAGIAATSLHLPYPIEKQSTIMLVSEAGKSILDSARLGVWPETEKAKFRPGPRWRAEASRPTFRLLRTFEDVKGRTAVYELTVRGTQRRAELSLKKPT